MCLNLETTVNSYTELVVVWAITSSCRDKNCVWMIFDDIVIFICADHLKISTKAWHTNSLFSDVLSVFRGKHSDHQKQMMIIDDIMCNF